MSEHRLWLGNGNHPDIESPEPNGNPGCVAFFPTEEAQEMAPQGAEFVAAVATSPRPGSDIRDGYFIGPSQSKAWKWVLWDFTYDNEFESWSCFMLGLNSTLTTSITFAHCTEICLVEMMPL
jgi:hypothetical protein